MYFHIYINATGSRGMCGLYHSKYARHDWKHIQTDGTKRIVNKTLGRALDPHANDAWLSKLTE